MKLLFLLLFPLMAQASFPEFFGASYSTTAIGNQSNLDSNDPSNNYYAPAVLAFSKKVNALIQATVTETHFKSIANITKSNTSTSSGTPTTGGMSNNYPDLLSSAIHLALPIGYEDHGTLGTLGLSIFLPVGKLIETNSGNPFLPEYVLYRSRNDRTSIYLNFAHAKNDEWAFSFGTLLGFQATADARADISLNGTTTYGSSAQARAKIAPSLGVIVSIAKKIKENKVYFTYQQEMKSNFHVHAYGEITSPTALSFDSNIDSVIFYDPHTFRLGGDYSFSSYQFFYGLEYQLWSNYETPVIKIKKNSGVMISSRDYEVISTRNTLNPRIGVKSNLTDRWSYSCSCGISRK
jgi:hypothetical protein